MRFLSVKTVLNILLVTKMLKIRPLCIFLLKTSAYKRGFNKTKCMSLLMKDKKLLKKYIEIWKKVSNIFKKEFDSKPA